MALPVVKSLGGRAQPSIPKGPRTPAAPKVKAPAMQDVATKNAMSAFHTALAQLQAASPQVNSDAIYAPYRASEQVAGHLGQGLQTAVQSAGQAAQTQYGQGLDTAQQHAAQFGISAGAGASPTALQNTGSAPLAQQTNAYAAAAPMAATQWQQLLERTAAGKVSDANIARDTGLTSARQSLAGSLPAAIANEKDFAFKQHAEKYQEGLAATQLDAKQNADLRSYLLGNRKLDQSASSAATSAGIKRDALAEKTSNDAAKLRVSQDALALKQRTSQATAKGLKGVAAAAKALTGTTSKAGTKKVAKGWDVQVVAIDPDTGDPTGDPKTIHVPDKRHAPKGFKLVQGASASTHYETVPTSAGSAGLTASTWDAQMRSLLAQNPGRTAEIKKFLGPRPKK